MPPMSSEPVRADLPAWGSPLAVGDLVRTGENAWPQYRIIAMSEDRAWVRDLQYGTDFVVPMERCRRVTLKPYQPQP
jgi:hypothetical protein